MHSRKNLTLSRSSAGATPDFNGVVHYNGLSLELSTSDTCLTSLQECWVGTGQRGGSVYTYICQPCALMRIYVSTIVQACWLWP
eukprot:scaffold659810_cov39-Prasinocladus_malaysianus.AAC.1